MFRRKMFTPASIRRAIISADSVAGPSVAMILVFRGGSSPLWKSSVTEGIMDQFRYQMARAKQNGMCGWIHSALNWFNLLRPGHPFQWRLRGAGENFAGAFKSRPVAWTIPRLVRCIPTHNTFHVCAHRRIQNHFARIIPVSGNFLSVQLEDLPLA